VIGRSLAIGILKGLWTLEALDKPSPGWAEIEADRVKSAFPADPAIPKDIRRFGPVMRYPNAGTKLPYRNLAREWIEANPTEWDTLLREYAEAEIVDAIPC
tara:strand:- start:37 stop:339 length:303 start_codon:yes stop_codon:yes gene_type:complete